MYMTDINLRDSRASSPRCCLLRGPASRPPSSSLDHHHHLRHRPLRIKVSHTPALPSRRHLPTTSATTPEPRPFQATTTTTTKHHRTMPRPKRHPAPDLPAAPDLTATRGQEERRRASRSQYGSLSARTACQPMSTEYLVPTLTTVPTKTKQRTNHNRRSSAPISQAPPAPNNAPIARCNWQIQGGSTRGMQVKEGRGIGEGGREQGWPLCFGNGR